MLPYPEPFVSKSKFLWGLQCPKLLWHAYRAKHLIPEPDSHQQAIFDQGHEVGMLARQVFPGGIEVAGPAADFDAILAASKEALKQRQPLYEAAFTFNGGYARADILNPAPNGAWDLIEVKSTTSVKDVHLADLAFQAWVLAGAGVELRTCLLAHINPDFVRRGPVNPEAFFVLADVSDQVSGLSREVEGKLDEMLATIRLGQHPDIAIGPHCGDPYPCPLIGLCWGHLPPGNVTTLYRGQGKGFRLLQDGISALEDIPNDFKLTPNQEIQRTAARTGQPHLEKAGVRRFLGRLKFPISYLDFETFATAIPLFDGLRPYQQVPFQFSLHVQGSTGANLEHHSFLADGRSDPRPEFMRCLQAVLPREGSVVAFNAPFEVGRLRECCKLLPEFGPWVAGIERRVVDLLLPFRAFDYYHPAQGGRASMKAVLPALTGRGYNHLAIQDGGMASHEFLRVHFGNVPGEERTRVRRQLEEYCALDTLGMMQIVESLRLNF